MSITKLLILAALIYVAIKVYQLLRTQAQAASRPAPPRQPAVERTAHEVLGVAPGASQAEIKAAYQRLVQQYHPDRVADLGPELKDVAEQRTKEINAAYAALKRG